MTDPTILPPTESFRRDCATIGIELPEHEVAGLGRYLHLLLETNKLFNLTAITEPEAAWRRHILESLSFLPHLAETRSVIDVGSGGGVPGIPLAIAMPEVRFTLLEATGKKANFLQTVIDDLKLGNVLVINDRAETVGQSKRDRQQYDAAISRAVGQMNVLVELCLPLVKVGGRMLAMKGAKAEAELNEATDGIMLLGGGELEVFEAMPGLEDEAVIVEIQKANDTPRTYPRRPGEPKRVPL